MVAAVNGLPLVVLEEAENSRMDGNLAMQLLGLWGLEIREQLARAQCC